MIIAPYGWGRYFLSESYIAYTHSAETTIKAKLSLQHASKFLLGAMFISIGRPAFRHAFIASTTHYKVWQISLVTV
jgi:hypothetical protein